ncbi:MAG: hypothetical protein KJ879_02175 [Nanoarchaeota archaeon]|nr:hypothetical protein [Nanoarchaeota archaeon]
MEEIVIKFDIPAEFKDEFKNALMKVGESLVRNAEFLIAKEIVSKSELSEQDAMKLASEVKKSVYERYKKDYPTLK